MIYTIATFCEQSFEGTIDYESLDEAKAFCDGFTSGAGHYGAGSVGAYILEEPEDMKDMQENEKPD
jgi:hypothetical protein